MLFRPYLKIVKSDTSGLAGAWIGNERASERRFSKDNERSYLDSVKLEGCRRDMLAHYKLGLGD